MNLFTLTKLLAVQKKAQNYQLTDIINANSTTNNVPVSQQKLVKYNIIKSYKTLDNSLISKSTVH